MGSEWKRNQSICIVSFVFSSLFALAFSSSHTSTSTPVVVVVVVVVWLAISARRARCDFLSLSPLPSSLPSSLPPPLVLSCPQIKKPDTRVMFAARGSGVFAEKEKKKKEEEEKANIDG